MVKARSSKSIDQEIDLKSGGSPWLDVDEAAKRINKTPRFVRRLLAEKRLRYFKHGHFVAILQQDLDSWATSEPHEPLR